MVMPDLMAAFESGCRTANGEKKEWRDDPFCSIFGGTERVVPMFRKKKSRDFPAFQVSVGFFRFRLLLSLDTLLKF